MSILDELNIPQPTQPAPIVQASASSVAALQAATAWKPAQPTKEFVDAVMAINAKGYGMPPLTGEAAQMFGVLNKHDVTANYKYGGSLDLARTNPVAEASRVVALSREMAALPVKGTPAPAVAAPMGLTSPETPASDPSKAALPVEGFAHPAAVTPNVQVPGLLASVTPTQAVQVLTNTTVTPAAVTAPAEEPKKKRGPKAKAAGDVKPTANESADDTQSNSRWLFIDCIPNVAYEDCSRFVAEWSTGLAKHFKLIAPYDDVRMAPKDHPLAYGAWKGALSGVAKNAAQSLSPGAYYINTESELGAAIAEGFSFARTKNADGTDGDPVFELIVRPTVRR